MAKKKPSFYHTRKQVMPNVAAAADLLGVTPEQVIEWDKEGAPAMAERLLLLWDAKKINRKGWDGWTFSGDFLIYKRERFWPGMLIEQKRTIEQCHELRMEINRIKSWRGLCTVFVDKVVHSYRRRWRRRGL